MHIVKELSICACVDLQYTYLYCLISMAASVLVQTVQTMSECLNGPSSEANPGTLTHVASRELKWQHRTVTVRLRRNN
jgi:hypothetical protein